MEHENCNCPWNDLDESGEKNRVAGDPKNDWKWPDYYAV